MVNGHVSYIHYQKSSTIDSSIFSTSTQNSPYHLPEHIFHHTSIIEKDEFILCRSHLPNDK